MSIKSDLKKDGIEVIKKLDTLTINSIASNVAKKLCDNFPDFGFDYNALFIKISRLDMYIIKAPEGMSEANYFYKNKSIYFSEHIPNDKLEKFAVHECIHHIQEVRDKKNFLVRMGLCDYSTIKPTGLALNEAAVQLITSKLNNTKKESVKYYNISFDAVSPNYYPIECLLVNELAYLVGEDTLFESTLFGNDNFKKEFIEKTSAKTFLDIENALDTIYYYEEEIVKINNKIISVDDRNKKVDNLIEKINSLKQNITSTFFYTQNLIISSYFDNAFKKIEDTYDIESFRKKLYSFKDYLGGADGYNFFNDYYVDKMVCLEEKYNLLESGIKSDETSLAVVKKHSKIYKFFHYLKTLILKNSMKQENALNYNNYKK